MDSSTLNWQKLTKQFHTTFTTLLHTYYILTNSEMQRLPDNRSANIDYYKLPPHQPFHCIQMLLGLLQRLCYYVAGCWWQPCCYCVAARFFYC